MRGKAAIAALAALVLARVPAGAQEDATPKIFLEKKVFAETRSGRKSFYEVHAVEEGESLWKILHRRGPVPREDYGALLSEFRRANPGIADPGKLVPGQRILVPSAPHRTADPRVAEGKAVAYRVAKGDTLTAILAARGVPRDGMPDYLAAVKDLNESVRDVDLIYAGSTILVPTDRHFASATALTKDVPPSAPGEMPPAKPEAQLVPPAGPGVLAGGAVRPRGAGDNAAGGEGVPVRTAEGALPLPRPPYRGLLSDLARGLGEKWLDRGMLYLPAPGGREVVLPLEDYPVVRFSTGAQRLLDFRSSLSSDVRGLVEATWSNYGVVALGDAGNPAEMIDRVLRSAGYHSVKEGIERPPVIGEEVSVVVPARWVVLRSGESLEVILVKEVPEQPGPALSAVLRYADRVGIRVLPYAVDPSAGEGFLVALDDAGEDAEGMPEPAVPKSAAEAVDLSLALLDIAPIDGERLDPGDRDGGAAQDAEPERKFVAGGTRYVVDAGTMTPALRAAARDAGYTIFPLGENEPGTSVLRRIIAAAGLSAEERRDFPIAGGPSEGFELRATGLFVTSPGWLASRNLRAVVIVRGKVHPATRALMRDFGVEIVGWPS